MSDRINGEETRARKDARKTASATEERGDRGTECEKEVERDGKRERDGGEFAREWEDPGG